MFHRRLFLLLAVITCAVAALGGQLGRLTVVQGQALRDEAEQRLSTRRLLPTIRGRILDRHGRVLAVDQACSDLAVRYDVLSGAWAYRQGRRTAIAAHRDKWPELSFEERERLIASYRRQFDQQVEGMWQDICDQCDLSRDELESRKRTIIRRVQSIRADVWDRAARRRAARIGQAVELEEVAMPIREETQAHTIVSAVPDSVKFFFSKHTRQYPGLELQASKRRLYPLKTAMVSIDRTRFPPPLRSDDPIQIKLTHVADFVIGRMRDVWAEDVDLSTGGRPFRRPGGRIDLGGYLPGDRIGHSGAEAAAESILRGRRGQVVTRLDTRAEQITDPENGTDINLALDVHLQARIQALMHPKAGLLQVRKWHDNDDLPEGTPLNGAAVVMDVDTGDLLAMVASPAGPRADVDQQPDTWPSDIDQPLFNRPIAAIYPPGSTLKPVVYALAAARRVIQYDQVIECQGHLIPGKPYRYRCWGWRPRQGKYLQHGPLGPTEAIARSCNIYFYTCGRDLGPRRLIEGLIEFGYGDRLNIGLPEAVGGIMPSLTEPNPPGRELSMQNATLIGIGQGPIAVTPLHVAAAHAALARGGYYLSPVLFEYDRPNQVTRDLALPPRVVDNVLGGMHASANQMYGTGHHIYYETGMKPTLDLPGVITRAKTGTAQAPTLFDDANDNNQLDEGETIHRAGSHSWYVCHVQVPGEQRARYVIAVIVEYGGSGGRVSGPLVNQVLYALAAEGYLPEPEPDTGTQARAERMAH